MEIKTNKTKEEKRILKTIGFYILLNAIILLSFAVIVRIYYVENCKNIVTEKYYNILLSNFETVEKDILNITSNVAQLKNDDFDKCMSYATNEEPHASNIASTIESLKNFMQSYEIADSVVIINRTLNAAITNDGKYSLDKFLNEEFVYSDYSYDY